MTQPTFLMLMAMTYVGRTLFRSIIPFPGPSEIEFH